MRRGALTLVLAALGCSGDEVQRVRVEFDPPPGFEAGTQLLTLRAPSGAEHYVVEPGGSVQFATQLMELERADLESRLFHSTPTELFLRPGPIEEGEVRLPPASATWSARFEAGAVSPWSMSEPGTGDDLALAFECPTYVVRTVHDDFDELLVGLVAAPDNSAWIADRFALHRWRDDTIETIDTSTTPLSRIVGAGASFVGFEDGRVGRLEDPDRLRVGTTLHLGAPIVDIAVSPDGATAYAIAEDGSVGRFADGTWTRLDSTRVASGKYRLTWTAEGDVLVTSRGDTVERWRGLERTEEPVAADLGLRPRVMNAVAYRDRTFVLAADRDAIPYLLESEGGVWRPVLTFETVVRETDHAIAHPRGILVGGGDGRQGFVDPDNGIECSAMRLSRGDVEGMVFLSEDTVLYDIASAEVWAVQLRGP